jgi:transcriptional regulator GlxA family with amidase domain
LLYDRFTALDIIGPYEVLHGLPDVELQFVAQQAGPVMVDSGAFALVAPYSFADVPSADVLVVPGSLATMEAAADRELTDWVRQMHTHTRWTTSVCSGALILGEAGLLRGLKATTHWLTLPFLERLGAEARPQERIVHQGKIITAAGVSAGIDMALYLVGQIAGPERAEAIQLQIEYDPQPPFHAGHTSKVRPEVQALAQRELMRAALTARESWALMRLLGRSFVSNLKNKKLSFRIEEAAHS